MTFWRHMLWSAVGAAVPALVLLHCGNDEKHDPRVQCPRAIEAGIPARGGMTACWTLAARDRLYEFKKENKITATCEGDYDLRCSGVTATGQPVKFKCDGRRCTYIAQWAW